MQLPDSSNSPEADSSGGAQRSAEELAFYPRSEENALEWLAVLGAAGISHRLLRHRGGWIIHVHPHDFSRGESQIQEFIDESRYWPPHVQNIETDEGAEPASTFIGGLLILFFIITGPADLHRMWFARGHADAAAIIADGELWRTVTALTLHGDFAHVLSNAMCCVLIGGALCRYWGSGIGWLMILAAGATGNALTAWFYGDGHHSVGASTAVFGALGLLGTMQAIRRFRGFSGDWRSVILPLSALIGILVFLTPASPGSRVDVMAHVFGLVAGVVLGLSYLVFAPYRKEIRFQIAAFTVAAVLTLAAWALALR